jgi:hypothetical protein
MAVFCVGPQAAENIKNLGEFSGGTMVRSALDGVNKGFDFPGKVDHLYICKLVAP